MGQLYVLLGSCTALAYLYEHSYVHTGLGKRKSKFIYFVLMTILICFGGFRGQYNDTWTYRDVYTYIVKPFPEAWSTTSWDLGENPAFMLVMSFLKTYDVEVHLFLFFFFFWTTIFFMGFIKRYASDFTLAIYFFITMGTYTFNMAAMKQVMATGICLAAIPLAMKKKWGWYVLLVLASSLFHPYSLMYLIVPLMGFRPWGKASFAMLGMIIAGGYFFQPMLGTIIDITSAIGENYTVEALSGDGVNILRLFAVWAPVVLSFLYRRILFFDCTKEERVFMNLTMIYAGILFVGLFGTALYFGRLSNYFSVMPVVTLPWMLQKIRRHYPKEGQAITVCAVIAFLVFFYFSNTLETLFSNSYAALSPIEFFKIFIEWLGTRL